VYVAQPEVKPGCVFRRSNISLLEKKRLVTDKEARARRPARWAAAVGCGEGGAALLGSHGERARRLPSPPMAAEGALARSPQRAHRSRRLRRPHAVRLALPRSLVAARSKGAPEPRPARTLSRERRARRRAQVGACTRNMNTFAFVGDLERSPEVSCVYHSEDAENQFLQNPKRAAMGDGFQPREDAGDAARAAAGDAR
jgi:hypothetical protein